MATSDVSSNSKHLSSILNVMGISLPLVRLRREEANYASSIENILSTNDLETLVVGSRGEGLGIFYGFQNESSSDTDIIQIYTSFKVYEQAGDKDGVQFSQDRITEILKIPDSHYPGYVRLQLLNIDERNLKNFCENIDGNSFLSSKLFRDKASQCMAIFQNDANIHGPAVTTDIHPRSIAKFTDFWDRSGRPLGISAEDFQMESETGVESTDIVFCLKISDWPNEAAEWVWRDKPSKWPSEALIEDITGTGCIFAAVGHKESDEINLQWRISLNIAEQMLLKTCNETQIHCFALLKLLKTDKLSGIADKIITTYIMKTILFWSLEEKATEEWTPATLIDCFCFCITKLKASIECGFLPNYFITKRNLYVVSELTKEVQSKFLTCLESILESPIEHLFSLCLISPFQNKPRDQLNEMIRQSHLKHWLETRTSMAQQFHATGIHSLWKLYDGFNPMDIFQKCSDAMRKINERKISYALPYVKLLRNCMGVLLYVNLKTEDNDSDTKEQKLQTCYMFFTLSLGADRTHTVLRVATCFLHEGFLKESSDLIKTVTDNEDLEFIMEDFTENVKIVLEDVIATIYDMSPEERLQEMKVFENVIDKDIKDDDPYKTVTNLREADLVGNSYGLFELAWQQCCFDVTFMPAELPILPKPIALEVAVRIKRKKASFYPLVYGLLLEYMLQEKLNSTAEEKEIIVEKLRKCVLRIPDIYKPTGYNFLAYCCLVQRQYSQAVSNMMKSFKSNPVKQNVAYLYISYITKILLQLDSGENRESLLYSRTQ